MQAHRRSLIIGLGIPAAAILVVMPLLANTDVHVLGVPLIFAWMFAWFPLTSLCLWFAWRIDEPRYRDETLGAAEEVD